MIDRIKNSAEWNDLPFWLIGFLGHYLFLMFSLQISEQTDQDSLYTSNDISFMTYNVEIWPTYIM